MKLGEVVWAVVDEEGEVVCDDVGIPLVGIPKQDLAGWFARRYGGKTVQVRFVRWVEEGGDGEQGKDGE